MKIRRLVVEEFRNLRRCDIKFEEGHFLNAVIGNNGSGKSNLIEAILHILIGVYFARPPAFDFELSFESRDQEVVLINRDKHFSVSVDGHELSLDHFSNALRDDFLQSYYPQLTLVYYSGECRRVRKLLASYQKHFRRLTRNPNRDTHRSLFVEANDTQAKVILLALFAHGRRSLLERLGIDALTNISVSVRSPKGYDPQIHEPRLWNSEGAIRRIISAMNETSWDDSSRPLSLRGSERAEDGRSHAERRTYKFSEGGLTSSGIEGLAERFLRGRDNVYSALEQLRAHGLLLSLDYKIRSRNQDLFAFDQLSEGEKQLIAVIGAVQLVNQSENLLLLDEPDTHLNPHWVWEYQAMLEEAFGEKQLHHTTTIMTTHDPVMISGLTREQVLLARTGRGGFMLAHPIRDPRGQGVANILCSSEFFGLPSSLDKETQKLLDERLEISIKKKLNKNDKARLKSLNQQLEIVTPGVSERDPNYVEFLRARARESAR